MINYFPSGSICSHSSTMKASQKGWRSQFGISFISYGLWLKYKVSWAIESHCQILKDNQEQGLWCPPEYLLLVRIPIGEMLNSSWKRRLFFISTQMSKNFKFLNFLIEEHVDWCYGWSEMSPSLSWHFVTLYFLLWKEKNIILVSCGKAKF